jgi:hypothetical protein
MATALHEKEAAQDCKKILKSSDGFAEAANPVFARKNVRGNRFSFSFLCADLERMSGRRNKKRRPVQGRK